jgi:ribosomal-protein-alanine N-acetyltransferase
MKTFVCRAADDNDLGFISQLSSEVFLEYGNYDEIVPAWFSEPGVITVVIVEDTYSLGFAMLSVESRTGDGALSAHLLAIAVDPGHQGNGLGSALLSHMEEVADNLGIGQVHLYTADVNRQALSFFQRAGYKVIGSEKRYYSEGQSALAMAKKLAP